MPWFKAGAMGVNKLNSVMKTMADKAGFDEKRRLTNYSARKTTIQKRNDNNIPPTHIMQLSGHQNFQSVNNYSTVSNEQQKNMSLILSGNSTSASTGKRPVSSLRSGLATECCESSFMKSSSLPAAGPFSGAVFPGGQFNITINIVNKSPTSTDHSTQSTRSFKRIKRVFESSDRRRQPPAGMLLKRGMGNGEWGMGNGEWEMGNGKLKMGNEKLKMGN